MRRTFADELLKHAKKDKDIILITFDLGYKMWDEFRDTFPNQFYNLGASEFAGMGVAVGMALENKKVFVYSITTFLLYRPYEMIRNYISHEKIPVRLVAGGRDFDYHVDGWSHHSPEAKQVLNTLPNIIQYWPETKEEIPLLVEKMVKSNLPQFISLKRQL